jgi:hypothetical protein
MLFQAFEDKYIEDINKELLRSILGHLDKFFNTIFLLEFFLKVTAYGVKKYFTDSWCLLDFFIVTVSYPSQN